MADVLVDDKSVPSVNRNISDSIDKYSVHTKTPNSQYGDITYSEISSDSQSFIEILDREFHNKAKDTYIETLLDLTDATDNLLTWYRTSLTSRPRGL